MSGDGRSGSASQALAEACAAGLLAKDAASRHLGLTLESVGPGAACVSVTVEPQMLNGLDVCHGGFIFALADTAMAYASNSRNRPALAQTCQVTFLAPARGGDRLTATARETAAAGRTGIHDVEVCNQDGKLLAVFRGQTRTVEGEIVTE